MNRDQLVAAQERAKEVNTVHGMTNTRVFRIWQGMKRRCLNRKRPEYKNYGGRGITVCERWMDFRNFFEDMGQPRDGYSLERIDVNGNYEPGNCVWASRAQQASNKRTNVFIEIDGEVYTLRQCAERFRINEGTLHSRLRILGWSVDEALRTKPKTGNNQNTRKQSGTRN